MTESNKPYKILCVGDLVADVFASPLSRLPQPGEQVLSETIAVYPGGNALNTAIALGRLGEQAAIAGSIGDDALGGLLINTIQEFGVDVSGVHREPNGNTASTIIIRAEGEDRRFVHSLGVAGNYTGEQISNDLIPQNGVVLIGGYLKLGAWDDDVLASFMQSAQQKGCQVVLNICLAKGSGVDSKRCLQLMKHVDIFVLNEDEAIEISGEHELIKQAQAIRQSGAKVVVITNGANGLFADNGDTQIDMGVFQVPLVDPSGCGDCFNAGLVAALLRGWDLRKVLEFGSAVGALGATALGCTNGVPAFEEVERFIRDKGMNLI
jgi:sugar/nucleoside kinase (ribokinase family)